MLNQISKAEKINYGIGSIAYSLPYTVLGGVFLIYATVILKIPPLTAGIIVAVSALWDGISDPLMGYITDKTKSILFGRRHLYLLVGSILTALFTWLFWSIDPASTLNVKIISLMLYILALKTTMTIFVIPYNALGGELSSDYDERSSVQSWRAGFYIFGMLLSLLISNMYFFRPTEEFAKGQLNPAAYPQMGATFAIMVIVIGLYSFFKTKHHIPSLPKSPHEKQSFKSFLNNIKGCLKNDNMRNLALMIFTIEVGFQIIIANNFHVSTFAYNLQGPQIGLLGLCLLGSSIASQPFWAKFTKIYDKKPALQLAGVMALIGFALGPWLIIWWKLIPIGSSQLLIVLGVLAIFAGFANGAFMSIPFSMISDAIDQTEKETGSRDDGMFFGVYTFAYKAGISVSLLMSGILLHTVGFDVELTNQSETTIFYLALVPSWLLILVIPSAFYFIKKYNISRASNLELKVSKKQEKHSFNASTDVSEVGNDYLDDELDSMATQK